MLQFHTHRREQKAGARRKHFPFSWQWINTQGKFLPSEINISNYLANNSHWWYWESKPHNNHLIMVNELGCSGNNRMLLIHITLPFFLWKVLPSILSRVSKYKWDWKVLWNSNQLVQKYSMKRYNAKALDVNKIWCLAWISIELTNWVQLYHNVNAASS